MERPVCKGGFSKVEEILVMVNRLLHPLLESTGLLS